jgi:DNA-binding LytR/AlgR family response regulator
MRVLAVDDVGPALDELRRLLCAAPGVEEVETAPDALAAVRLLQAARFDAVFLDIAMPGMDGMELAALFTRMTEPPAIVFVTAFDEHAAAAYQIGAVDYLLKPISAERLAAALDRVRRFAAPDPTTSRPPVEAQGDYVRLHTPEGSHLLRIPISRLEGHWADAGFLRVHRGFLLAVARVRELRSDIGGGLLAHTDVGDVPVSRRHARELRERLLDAATKGVFE